MVYNWSDAVGLVGVLFVLVMFAGSQFGKLNVQGFVYPGCNAVGAALILLSLSQDFNLPAFVIECAWLLISLAGLLYHHRSKGAQDFRLEQSNSASESSTL